MNVVVLILKMHINANVRQRRLDDLHRDECLPSALMHVSQYCSVSDCLFFVCARGYKMCLARTT